MNTFGNESQECLYGFLHVVLFGGNIARVDEFLASDVEVIDDGATGLSRSSFVDQLARLHRTHRRLRGVISSLYGDDSRAGCDYELHAVDASSTCSVIHGCLLATISARTIVSLRRVTDHLQPTPEAPGPRRYVDRLGPDHHSQWSRLWNLNPAQTTIAQMTMSGHSDRSIATHLRIPLASVRSTVTMILRRADASSRVRLLERAGYLRVL